MNRKSIKTGLACAIAVMALAGIGWLGYSILRSDDEEEGVPAAITQQEQTVVEVDTTVLRRQTFMKQILCNGKLSAVRRAELLCPKAGEVLMSVNVKNGQRVTAGTLLAQADMRERKREVEKARHDLERARVELQDKLIALGYDGGERDVPAEVLHRAEVTSGYYTARYALQSAEASLGEHHLPAG